MTRAFDILFSLVGLVVCIPVFVALYGLCWLDTGSPLFRQERVGRRQEPFALLKFRTMKLNTASVATHLVDATAVTKFGKVLRRTKLDELPQLWNVLKGEMSLVGPRPCLPNQLDLISKRFSRGVFEARPGMTGLAQIRRVDMSTPELLAEIDQQMLDNFGVRDYFIYILKTLTGV